MPFTLLVPPSLGNARAHARAELLETSLTSELAIEVKVRVALDYEEIQRETLAATVELAWAPAAILAQLTEARAVLRAIRAGHARYHSALVARSGGSVTLANLTGKRAAWVDPLSAGGYLLPLAWLRGRGIEPNLVFDEQTFLGSHRAVVDAVLEGTADVCAVSTPSPDAETLRKALALYAGAAADRLETFGVTDAAPTDALVLTARVDPGVAERVVKKLAPAVGRGRTPSFLLTAMEAERLEPTTLDEYRAVRSLLWAKRSERPVSVPPTTRRTRAS